MFVNAKERDGKKYVIDSKGTEYELLPFSLDKPNIPEDKILDPTEQIQVLDALRADNVEINKQTKTVKEKRNLIFNNLIPAKNDYHSHYDKGTVCYTKKARNYCFSKVIISDGTTIKGANFTQVKPHINAIQGKNLHFIECNLNNVERDPTWTYDSCLLIHTKLVKKSEIQIGNDKEITTQLFWESKGKWKLSKESTEPYNIKQETSLNERLNIQNGTI